MDLKFEQRLYQLNVGVYICAIIAIIFVLSLEYTFSQQLIE